jgi:hypothetical protein
VKTRIKYPVGFPKLGFAHFSVMLEDVIVAAVNKLWSLIVGFSTGPRIGPTGPLGIALMANSRMVHDYSNLPSGVP